MNLVKIIYAYDITHDGISARHVYDNDTSEVNFHNRADWKALVDNIKEQHAEVEMVSAAEELYRV